MTCLIKTCYYYWLCLYFNKYADPLVSRYRMVLQLVLNQPSASHPCLLLVNLKKNVECGHRRLKSNPITLLDTHGLFEKEKWWKGKHKRWQNGEQRWEERTLTTPLPGSGASRMFWNKAFVFWGNNRVSVLISMNPWEIGENNIRIKYWRKIMTFLNPGGGWKEGLNIINIFALVFQFPVVVTELRGMGNNVSEENIYVQIVNADILYHRICFI